MLTLAPERYRYSWILDLYGCIGSETTADSPFSTEAQQENVKLSFSKYHISRGTEVTYRAMHPRGLFIDCLNSAG